MNGEPQYPPSFYNGTVSGYIEDWQAAQREWEPPALIIEEEF